MDPQVLRLAEATHMTRSMPTSHKPTIQDETFRGRTYTLKDPLDYDKARSSYSISPTAFKSLFDGNDDDGKSSRSATRPLDSPLDLNEYGICVSGF